MICKTCKKDLPDGEFYLYTKGDRMLMRSSCKPCYRIDSLRKKGRSESKPKPAKPIEIFDLQILWKKVVQKEMR